MYQYIETLIKCLLICIHWPMHDLEWKGSYFDLDFAKFVCRGPIENKSTLPQVKARHQKGY